MLKTWVELWAAVVRQVFARQQQLAASEHQNHPLSVAPDWISVDQPVVVDKGAENTAVVIQATVPENPNPNRHRRNRTQDPSHSVRPPVLQVIPEEDYRRRRRSRRRNSTKRTPPKVNRLSKPLPPVPDLHATSFLAVPRASLLRPAAPQRLSQASRAISLRSSKVSGRLFAMAEEVTFKDVMKALYDYEATAEDELALKEDQILYLLGQLDDDWSKVQAHTPLDSPPEGEPPVGLVPAAYIEPAIPLRRATAVYDYEPSGEGEITMKENEKMNVYLEEDDWILVKLDSGAIGYIPANYVEEGEGESAPAAEPEPEPKAVTPMRVPPATAPYRDPAELAAAAASKLKSDPVETWSISEVDSKGKKKKGTLGVGNGSIFFASEADKAPVQQWPSSSVTSVHVNEDKHKHVILVVGDVSLEFSTGSKDTAETIVQKVETSRRIATGDSPASPPANGPASPVPIKAPVPSTAGDRLVPPPAHPGLSPSPSGKSKGVHWDTAPPEEIAPNPPALQSDEEDVEDAAQSMQQLSVSAGNVATAMYDFDADGDDELNMKEGERLTIIDKESSDEWWKCRNSRGQEGVVPASYLELEEGDADADADAEATAARAAEEARKEQAAAAAKVKKLADERRKREQEAREAREAREAEEAREKEESEAREAARKQKADQERRAKEREARQREREAAEAEERKSTSSNGRSTNGSGGKNTHARAQSKDLPGRPSQEKTKPTNTRIWHDRSGQFKVDAQYLGLHNGKVRLHKSNGVIIEVPEEKMSAADMDYIRKVTARKDSSAAQPNDDDNVPLGELTRKPTSAGGSATRPVPTPRKSTVDWFEFFLSAGCDIDDCTRYAASFDREKMDEAVLPHIKPETLRSLGLREGDIIRVMKKIEERNWKALDPRSTDPRVQEQIRKDAEIAARLQEQEYGGRSTPQRSSTASPGLFTGPGGALRNNTRRGRPTPTKSSTLGVDSSTLANASEQLSRTSSPAVVPQPTGSGSATTKSPSSTPAVGGFDDDAWTPRPASAAGKSATPAPRPPSAPAVAPTPPPAPAPPAPPVQAAAPPAPPAPPVTAATTTGAQQSTGEAIQRPATSNAPASALPSEFDNLARLAAYRPPSAPVAPPQPPAIQAPTSYQNGLGMGSSPAPLGSLLSAQQTGALGPLQPVGGPRAPYAPVPANEGLLKPLVPTTTGFNSFVPTRPTASSPLGNSPSPSFLQTQPTGFNPGFNNTVLPPLQTQPTGFGVQPSPYGAVSPPPSIPSATGSSFSTLSTMSSNYQTPLTAQPTGFGGGPFGNGFAVPGSGFVGGNPGSNFVNALQNQPTGFQGPPSVSPPQQDNTPANVFASMKAGAFANSQAPQSSDKYDALRPQPTGWGALGGQPNPGFQQPMQTGYGFGGQQPGYGTGFGYGR